MLERKISPAGLGFYVSPLLRNAGAPHAFSTRLGGLSPAPFDSLNLGNPNGSPIQDDPERIRQNYRLLCQAAGLPDRPILAAHQVHGRAAVRLSSRDIPENDPKADALLTDDPACVLSVRIADCVPILIATADGRAVAAVHAGWRGVVAGVVPAALAALRQMNHPGPCLAAIGPCISMDAFEVGLEVADEFTCVFGPAAPIRLSAAGKAHIDLRRAVQIQLLRAGLAEEQIDTTDRCTHRDADEFFSHRRDNGITGRMAALIAPRTM
jgi:hypothetical protein